MIKFTKKYCLYYSYELAEMPLKQKMDTKCRLSGNIVTVLKCPGASLFRKTFDYNELEENTIWRITA